MLALLPQNRSKDTLWQQNLRSIVDEWKGETGDTPQPVPAILEYLYETLTELRHHSGNLGNGIFLSTVHSVKGLEFDHVFVLGDSWQQKQAAELEEERRLYYVSMSRAREPLHHFALQHRENPHTALLTGKEILRKTTTPDLPTTVPDFQYAILGMKELYIDYGGRKTVNHPIHKELSRLKTGDILQIKTHNNRLNLVTQAGVPVAQLSHSAAKYWQGKTNAIQELKVLAMVSRKCSDIRESDFADRYAGLSAGNCLLWS